jgi:hypothetical protein
MDNDVSVQQDRQEMPATHDLVRDYSATRPSCHFAKSDHMGAICRFLFCATALRSGDIKLEAMFR